MIIITFHEGNEDGIINTLAKEVIEQFAQDKEKTDYIGLLVG